MITTCPIVDVGSPINWGHQLNRGLIGRWQVLPLGQWAGGTQFKDLCRVNNGTLTNGPTWSGSRPGGFGSLLLTSGATPTYVAMSSSATPTLATYSMCYWARATSGGSSAGEFQKHQFGFSAGAKISLTYQGGAFPKQNSLTTVSSGVWYHVCMTFAGTSAGDTKIYVNGVDNSDTAVAILATDNTANHRIGRSAGFDALAGDTDDWRLFNRVLSSSEIYSVYQASRQQFDPTLNWIRRRSRKAAGVAPTTSALLRRRRMLACS